MQYSAVCQESEVARPVSLGTGVIEDEVLTLGASLLPSRDPHHRKSCCDSFLIPTNHPGNLNAQQEDHGSLVPDEVVRGYHGLSTLLPRDPEGLA